MSFNICSYMTNNFGLVGISSHILLDHDMSSMQFVLEITQLKPLNDVFTYIQ